MVKEQVTKPTINPDFKKPIVVSSINKGKELIKSGKTKAEVSREIYPLIKDQSQEVILHVFREGVNLTEKGSLTYLYNIRRKLKKEKVG